MSGDATSDHPRPFTMGDLMILIAGIAAGMAEGIAQVNSWSHPKIFVYSGGLKMPVEIDLATLSWDTRLYLCFGSSITILAPLFLALFICRLLRPSPRLRDLTRQPGAVALAISALHPASEMALHGVAHGFRVAWDWSLSRPVQANSGLADTWRTRWGGSQHELGPMIAACWFLLVLSGRWRVEPSWIDRAGRCVGVYWILIHLVQTCTGRL